MQYSTRYSSPIGALTLACDSDGKNLTGLWMEGQKYYGGTIYQAMQERNDMPVFGMIKAWLDQYFAGERPSISTLPLAPAGSAFRLMVWDILREIPYGELLTYGEIANRIAAKSGRERMSSRAVGGAVGHNPISIIIPCHRVIGANNSLTGYSGGLSKKIKLLELEGVDISRLHTPKKGAAL